MKKILAKKIKLKAQWNATPFQPAGASNLFDWLYSYFIGCYWLNERMSDIEEYNDYLKYKNK